MGGAGHSVGCLQAADVGAGSILSALGQHDGGLLDDGVDLGQVDTAAGAKITSHISGGSEGQVVNALGGLGQGSSGGLIQKLLPILAPIVMSWSATQLTGGGSTSVHTQPSAPSSGAPVSLQDMLQNVLGGAVGSASSSSRTTPGGLNPGSILTDILDGMLGGGTR